MIDLPPEGADAGLQGPEVDLCVVCGAVMPDQPAPGYSAIWGESEAGVEIVGWTCCQFCTVVYEKEKR